MQTQALTRIRATGLIAVCLVVVSFVGFVLVSRWGLRTSMRPMDLAALRFAVAGAVMLPLVCRHGLLGLGPLKAATLAMTGGLGFALLAYAGIALAPANHGSALIHGALPLMTLVASLALGASRPGVRQIVGSLFVGYGVLAIGSSGFTGPDGSRWLGDACLLAASLSWSVYAVLVRRWSLPVAPAAALVASISALVYLPAYLAWGDPRQLLAAELGDVLLQAFFQGLWIGVGSIVFYTAAVRSAGAQTTAFAAASVPALTTLAAIPMLGELPSAPEGIGIALITFGIPHGAGGKEPAA